MRVYMKHNGHMVPAPKGSKTVRGRWLKLDEVLAHIASFDHIQQHYNGHHTCANCDCTPDDPHHLEHCWLGQFLAKFGYGRKSEDEW